MNLYIGGAEDDKQTDDFHVLEKGWVIRLEGFHAGAAKLLIAFPRGGGGVQRLKRGGRVDVGELTACQCPFRGARRLSR